MIWTYIPLPLGVKRWGESYQHTLGQLIGKPEYLETDFRRSWLQRKKGRDRAAVASAEAVDEAIDEVSGRRMHNAAFKFNSKSLFYGYYYFPHWKNREPLAAKDPVMKRRTGIIISLMFSTAYRP